MTQNTSPTLCSDQTAELIAWHTDVTETATSEFDAAETLSTRLGSHVNVDGTVTIGFWTPELTEADVPEADVYLELYTPTGSVDLTTDETAAFDRHQVPVRQHEDYTWAVVDNVSAGTRQQLGTLYQLVYKRPTPGEALARESDLGDEEWGVIPDPLADSVPFGVYAPSEIYDMQHLHANRADRDYFASIGTDAERVATSEDDGLPRVDPAVSMLEIHPGTATEAGSLGGLARKYETIGEKLQTGEALTPAERNFVGYDAIQLMPTEPITQNPDLHDYWTPQQLDRSTDAQSIEVEIGNPEMINWGYDIVVSAFSATNPAILESNRPDELVDFIAACHNLPEPIKVVFDIALGHADNGAIPLLSEHFFEGPGMYGKHLDYTEPTVRAILLELQRRKMDLGADGIRVDGAQDFRYWDPEREEMIHDDAYLAKMDAITQEVAGTEYRPWMIYEDGRPWPQEDWELASTYRTLIEQHPHAFQWSPVTFAHNTPALLTFWATKWWRVKEVAEFGSQWITGVANHDTIRRGTQTEVGDAWNAPQENPHLAETLPETLNEAYNSPAATMLFYCFMPGVPMDFVGANMRSPWGFIRDTDPTWNVKVVAEEAYLVDWQIPDDVYGDDRFFGGLKSLGFTEKDDLRMFIRALLSAVDLTDYDLDAIATVLSTLETPFGKEITADDLETFAYAWMEDIHHYANLSHWADEQDDERTAFDLAVREFRHERPWLRSDIDHEGNEAYGYRHPTNGTVLYYGLRESPDGDEQLLFAANMEGPPIEVSPEIWADEIADLPTDGWEPALAAPAVATGADRDSVTLGNVQSIVWRRSL